MARKNPSRRPPPQRRPPQRQPPQRQPPQGRQPQGKSRPLPGGTVWFTPNASPLRARIERATAPLLVIMHRAPRAVVALAPLFLLIIGILLPPIPGLVVFLIVALFVSWLAFITWPGAPPARRLMQVGVLTLLVVVAIARAVGT